jgi:hypothetical protein
MRPEITDWFVEHGATVSQGDVSEGCAEATTGVSLLRFGVSMHNDGTRDLQLGNPQCPAPCTEHPLEICTNPEFVCSPAEGHNHAHYNNYARYELFDAATQAVVIGHKQGFCLLDSVGTVRRKPTRAASRASRPDAPTTTDRPSAASTSTSRVCRRGATRCA